MTGWIHDLRLALRALRSRWRFSLLVVVTMAVGIGATVGVWAYLSYFVRPTLDAPDPERLVWLRNPAPDDPYRMFTVADWRDLGSAREEVFERDAASRLYSSSLQAPATTLHVFGNAVSGEYFELLGARPALGRLIGPQDDRAEAEPVLVLSHLTWRRDFGADPAVIGQTVTLDGRWPYSVVGVAEPRFQGTGVWVAAYTPLAHAAPLLSRGEGLEEQSVLVLGRLAPDVSVDEARGRLASAVTGLEEARPLAEPRQVALESVEAFDDAYAEEPIYLAARVLMAAVVLLLLLACANVANLLLAQGLSRRRETAVHAALGAGRGRVTRRVLIESVLLSLAGGIAGLLFVSPVLRLIEYYLRLEIPVSMGDWASGTRLIVDETELALFVAGVSVASGVLFGLAPVLQTLRLDLVTSLKSEGTLAGGRRIQGRDLLVVIQIGLSVMLLVGAALLAQTFWQLRDRDLGFEPRDLFLATVYLPKHRLADGDEVGRRLLPELAERLAELPGIERSSVARQVPLSFQSEMRVTVAGERATVNHNSVGPGYFETLGIELLAGRAFEDRDDAAAPPVAILDRTAAEALFPGRTAIGQRIELHRVSWEEPGEEVEVVGVVADSLQETPSRPRAPMLFLPFDQHPWARSTLLLRGRGPVERQVRDLLRSEYPDLAVVGLVPFEEQAKRALANQRMNAELSGGLGALGLLLAGFGVFSVMSYAVSQRTREIGIRMALGARRSDVGRWVLAGTLRRVGTGLAIGLLSSWWLARVLESLLVGVEARDPWTLLAVATLLGLCSLVAAWLPARRATRVDPMRALRQG